MLISHVDLVPHTTCTTPSDLEIYKNIGVCDVHLAVQNSIRDYKWPFVTIS